VSTPREAAAGGIARRAGVSLAIVPIRLYQALFSPILGPRCRYYPTCSAYAVDALRSFGILRGLVLAAWRVARCNPWSRGGVDRAEDQRLFRATAGRSRPSPPHP
jgi:hypothetical protein